MADDTKANEMKLGEPPKWGRPIIEVKAFLTRGYGLPEGYYVTRVIRHGGRDGTGLDVLIRPPGDGDELRIAYERESDCANHNKLRARAVAATNGLARPHLITSPNAAMAMYEALCTMADHFEAADQRGQTWEWVQQLRRVAAEAIGSPDDYWALRQLQDHDYSKALMQDPPLAPDGKRHRPIPLLLIDPAGGSYVTARHMAVFLRYDLGVEDAGTDDRILTRLTEIGGERLEVQEWDSTARDRSHHVILVLYRLPEEAPGDPE